MADGQYKGPGYDYVDHAAPACTRGGCQFSAAAELVNQTGQTLAQLMRGSMSQALWCDATDHAFSANDPHRQRLSIATGVVDPDTGEAVIDPATGKQKEVLQARDFCGECARAAGLIKAPKGKYDPLKTKVLETQAGLGTDAV